MWGSDGGLGASLWLWGCEQSSVLSVSVWGEGHCVWCPVLVVTLPALFSSVGLAFLRPVCLVCCCCWCVRVCVSSCFFTIQIPRWYKVVFVNTLHFEGIVENSRNSHLVGTQVLEEWIQKTLIKSVCYFCKFRIYYNCFDAVHELFLGHKRCLPEHKRKRKLATH